MLEISLISPLVDPSLDALKIAALYFDKVTIPSTAVLQFDVFSGNASYFRRAIDLPDQEFRQAVRPLVDEGLLEFVPVATLNDTLGMEGWKAVSARLKHFIDAASPMMLGDLHDNEPSSGSKLAVPPELLTICQRYLRHPQDDRKFVVHTGFVVSYYGALFATLLSQLLSGHLPITASPLLSTVAHKLVSADESSAAEKRLQNVDALMPHIAPEVLRLSVPDISHLDFGDILEIRERLSEGLADFRQELGEVTHAALGQARGAPDLAQLRDMVNYRVQPAVGKLEKMVKGSSLRVLQHFFKALQNPAAYVPLLGSLFQQIPAQLAISLSFAFVSLETALEYFSQRKEIHDNGLMYLLHVANKARRKAASPSTPLKPVEVLWEDFETRPMSFRAYIPFTLEPADTDTTIAIDELGDLVVSQVYLMQLAGSVFESGQRIPEPSDDKIQDSREAGRSWLKRFTGEDFGYDVQRWFAHLVKNERSAITHRRGYWAMRKVIKELGEELPFKKDIVDSA